MSIFKRKAKLGSLGENGKTTLGSRERRLLAESAQIEEELVPAFVRPLLVMAGIMVVLSLIWAGLTNLSEVARAQGEIVPSGEVKVVQHLDGGVVSEIKVDDRTFVEQGQELIKINGSQVNADLLQIEVRLISLKLRAERLESFANGHKPQFDRIAGSHLDLLADQTQIYNTQMATRKSTLSILDRQINQRSLRIQQLRKALDAAREQQAISGELLSMREGLASRHLVNRSVLLETQRAKVSSDGEVVRLADEIDVVGQELAEIQSRRADTINQMTRDALNEVGAVRAEIAEAEEASKRLSEKVARLVVRSPARGYVHNLKVQTIGQVVQPGAIMMQIVPTDAPLEAIVHIAARDIGYVKVGEQVKMQVSTYDYTRFGFANGTLKKISATNLVDDKGQPYFEGWVALSKPYVGDKPANLLQPGMGVEAEILTGQRTLLAYLLKPLRDINLRSFGER